MSELLRTLTLARGKGRQFVLVAVLVSLGTGAALFEPWIHRAIVDDITGVFARHAALEAGAERVEKALGAVEHLTESTGRILKAPLRPHRDAEHRRALAHRTGKEAATTVLLGAVLLVLTKLLAEALRVVGDNRAAGLANAIERDFIVRTFRHVMRLPLSYFSRRPTGAVARQIDQSKDALETISRGRTTLVIAHRKSMLTRVDRVLVLRGGRIEQDGTPDRLLAQPGYFREMMTAQESA